MAIRWDRLAGDTSVFALRIAFADDPDDGQGISPDVALSWGSFQIWVNGRNLCAHQEEGEHINAVHWYQLPLIEWFACNWDALLHEERLPVRNEGDTGWASLRATMFPPPAVELDEEKSSRWESTWQRWWARHALRATREGGLFPDVVLRRFRDSIEVSWGSVRSGGMPHHFEFVESAPGSVRLSPRDVAAPLHDVLSEACQYLLSLAPESQRLSELSAVLHALDADERHEERLSWLAGIGADEGGHSVSWQRAKHLMSELADAPRRAILECSEVSPLVVSGSCHAALMFGSFAPNVTESDVLALARTMVELYSPQGDPHEIVEMSRSAPVDQFATPSWSQGYRLAEEIHEELHMDFARNDLVDVDALMGQLGIEILELDLSDESIRGVSIAGPQHRPGIVVNTRHNANEHAHGRRFTLAHEFCHLLFDRVEGRRLALASGPWAPRDIERRANAFAAMLLMPVDLIQRTISDLPQPVNTTRGLLGAVRRLQVGATSLLHHLTNLGFIEESERSRMEEELVSSDVR